MYTNPPLSIVAQQRGSRRHSLAPVITGTYYDSSSPPAYQSSSQGHRSARRHSQQLPAYSRAIGLDFQRQFNATSDFHDPHSPSCQQHEFNLASGSGSGNQPWATLRVFSRNSESQKPQKAPKFFGGDTIAGRVEFNLDKPLSINWITISLRGRFITSSLEEGSFTFLNQTITIWNKDLGDPRHSPLPSSNPSSVENGSKKSKFNAKLQGTYQWPFSFPFPTEIYLPHRSGGLPQQVILTPQSFIERGINANIQYHLVMHINHGLFRPNSKLQAAINYTPNIIPPPSSPLRQHAYRQGGFLCPPPEDPSGWLTLTPARFFHQSRTGRTFDLRCTLSLAQPLSYTRGTVIPYFIVIQQPPSQSSSSSTQRNPALDLTELFVSPNKPLFSVLLQRRVTFLQDAAQALARSAAGSLSKDSTAVGMKVAEEMIGRGVWWCPDTMVGSRLGVEEDGIGYLEGEIHLPEDLQPSCQGGFFSIEYSVALAAHPHILQSEGASRSAVSSTSQTSDILAIHPIRIATSHQDGPLPTPFTPPPNHPSFHHSALGLRDDLISRSKSKGDEVGDLEVFTRMTAMY